MILIVYLFLLFSNIAHAANKAALFMVDDSTLELMHVHVDKDEFMSVAYRTKHSAENVKKWLGKKLSLLMRRTTTDSGIAEVEATHCTKLSFANSAKVQLQREEVSVFVHSGSGRMLVHEDKYHGEREKEYFHKLISSKSEQAGLVGCWGIVPSLSPPFEKHWTFCTQMHVRWSSVVETFQSLIRQYCKSNDIIVCSGVEGLAVMAAAAQEKVSAFLRPEGELFDEACQRDCFARVPWNSRQNRCVIISSEFNAEEVERTCEVLRQKDVPLFPAWFYLFGLSEKDFHENVERLGAIAHKYGYHINPEKRLFAGMIFEGVDKVFLPPAVSVFTRLVPDISSLELKNGYIIVFPPTFGKLFSHWWHAQAVLWDLVQKEYPGKWKPIGVEPYTWLSQPAYDATDAYYVSAMPEGCDNSACMNAIESWVGKYSGESEKYLIISKYVPYVSKKISDGDFFIGGTAEGFL